MAIIRKILICIIVAMSVAISGLTAENRLAINVVVTGGEPSEGQVLVSLFNSSESYMEVPIFETSADVDVAGSAIVALGTHAPGEYAIVVVYDKNKNGKLDTGLFRIPKEKIGYSSNAKGNFGPAKWRDARFKVTNSDLNLDIQLANAKRD